MSQHCHCAFQSILETRFNKMEFELFIGAAIMELKIEKQLHSNWLSPKHTSTDPHQSIYTISPSNCYKKKHPHGNSLQIINFGQKTTKSFTMCK